MDRLTLYRGTAVGFLSVFLIAFTGGFFGLSSLTGLAFWLSFPAYALCFAALVYDAMKSNKDSVEGGDPE